MLANGTECLLKSVFQPLVESLEPRSSSSKSGSGSTSTPVGESLLSSEINASVGSATDPPGAGVELGSAVDSLDAGVWVSSTTWAGTAETRSKSDEDGLSELKAPVMPMPTTVPTAATRAKASRGISAFLCDHIRSFHFEILSIGCSVPGIGCCVW